MTYNNEIIDKLIELGKWLHNRNYTPGYSGNISVRRGANIIITTSGSANGFLTRNQFVEIGFDGVSIESGKKPSSEKMLHIKLYESRPEVNCVIHVHSTALSAFAASGKDLMEPVLIENVCYFGGIPLANYGMPSSKELVDETAKYFDKHCIVLMKNHGVIIGGTSVEDAYLKLEMAEEYAKTIIYAKVLGGLDCLSQIEVDNLYKLIKS